MLTKSLVREMTYSNILSINAVYIFQRDPNSNSRFHNTKPKPKFDLDIKYLKKLAQKFTWVFIHLSYMTNISDWLCPPVVNISEQIMLILQSYILFLNTITDLSKLSIIKPGVRVRGLPSRYETFERS